MLLADTLYPCLGGPERCVTTSILVLPLIKAMSCYHKQTCHDRHACNVDCQVDHKDVVDIKNGSQDVVDIKNWVTRCDRHQELGYNMW